MELDSSSFDAEERKFLCQNFVNKFWFSVLCSKSQFVLQRIDSQKREENMFVLALFSLRKHAVEVA